jgi:hypothetical protein
MKGAESPDKRGVVTGLLLQQANGCKAAIECAKCSGVPLRVLQTARKVSAKFEKWV